MFKYLINNKTILLGLTLILSSFFLLLLTIPRNSSPEKTIVTIPADTTQFKPERNELYPFLKTVPGEAFDTTLKKLSTFKTKTTQGDTTAYLFASPRVLRDDQIITRGDAVVFERKVSVFENEMLPNISSFIEKYGEPERIFNGSYYYGDEEITYLWANKGFALLVHGYTNSVNEIHTFQPTTIENYLTQWGEDIYTEPNPISDP